jgi:large subunit ribosomal protein L21
MYAVIRNGGKQYRVSPGELVDLERTSGNPGTTIELTDVLLVSDGQQTRVGQPVLSGAVVVAQIVAQDRDAKVTVFKKQRRKNYRRTRGHRQSLTRVRITEIRTA